MQPWQIELVKAAVLGLVAFGGGYGASWLKNREKEKEADLRERQRQAEFDEFKNRRRLIGSGEVEKMERADKLTDILIKQKQHGITSKELEEANELLLGKKRKRTKAETIDPPTEELGLNGGKIGYLPNADKVEWIIDDQDDQPFPMLLRRNDNDILAAYNEFWDKVWWNRHRSIVAREGLDPTDVNLSKGEEAAQKIEAKYGSEKLEMDLFDYGLLSGKMSALSWVMGSEWEESLDT